MWTKKQQIFCLGGIFILIVVVGIFILFHKNIAQPLAPVLLPSIATPPGWRILSQDARTSKDINFTDLPANIPALTQDSQAINPATLGFANINIRAYELDRPTDEWIRDYIAVLDQPIRSTQNWGVVRGHLVLKTIDSATPADLGLSYYLFDGNVVYIFELTPYIPNVTKPIALTEKQLEAVQLVIQEVAGTSPM